jgi:hypothetical protein
LCFVAHSLFQSLHVAVGRRRRRTVFEHQQVEGLRTGQEAPKR